MKQYRVFSIKYIGILALIVLATILYTLYFIPASHAQTAVSPSARTETKEVNQQQRITNAKQRADAEINNRVNSLNGLITRINNMKKLSSDSKASMTSQIQTQISSLTALKAKIDADTDIETLKTDINSIIDSFRIYALFIPKVHILSVADVILQTIDKFTDVETRLQAGIDKAKAAGKDVTLLQAKMTDMQAKVADARLQANNAINTVTPLQPGPDPQTFKPQLKSAKEMLVMAHHDLQAARKDAQDITGLTQ